MSKYRVACLDVWESAVQQAVRDAAPENFEPVFATSYDDAEQLALAADADFILAGWAPVPARLIRASARLRMLHKWGIGVDKFDLDAARAAGVPVAITAGGNANPVAEHAVMLMLAVCRKLAYADRSLRAGIWLKAEMRSITQGIMGRTVGLLGFGNIGRMVARKLSGFETRVIYFDMRRADPSDEADLGVEYVAFDDLLAQSDLLSIHLPAVAGTTDLIDAQAIAGMKGGAVIINTARGGIVNEAALYDALVSGKLFGAGLDVFDAEPPANDHPLFGLDNVVLTPHVAGATFDNVGNVARHAFTNMRRILAGEPIPPQDVIVPAKD